MLGVESKEEKEEVSEGEDELSFQPLILPHFSFMPGDGRYYLLLFKPANSTLMLKLNDTGDILHLNLTFEGMEEAKQIISKALEFKKDFLSTLIHPFTENNQIIPSFPLINSPVIHEKGGTHILVSFPIKQHKDTGPLIF